jgi:hypothetical protein
MSKITALRAGRGRGKRVNIYLDGKFAFSLEAEVAIREGLRVEQELSTERIKTLSGADNLQRCLNAAALYLSYRPRSEPELRERLRRRGFDGKPGIFQPPQPAADAAGTEKKRSGRRDNRSRCRFNRRRGKRLPGGGEESPEPVPCRLPEFPAPPGRPPEEARIQLRGNKPRRGKALAGGGRRGQYGILTFISTKVGK